MTGARTTPTQLAALVAACLVLLATGQQASCKTMASGQKTADLSVLVNETVAIINSKQQQQQQQQQQQVSQSFRDDWTFDRVERDLIEFLQELNARYQHGAQSEGEHNAKQEAKSQALQPLVGANKGANVEEPLLEARANKSLGKETSAGQSTEAPPLSRPLPVSLAAGDDDRDLSESNWQYGIFDRFTRARASSTPAPHHNQGASTAEPLIAASGLDVRAFNSDECGLRLYGPDGGEPEQAASFFPLAAQQGGVQASDLTVLGGEASKELNQRRQRPPPLSVATAAAASKRKPAQPQQTSVGEGAPLNKQAELGGDRLDAAAGAEDSNTASDDELSQGAVESGQSSETATADNEFNLNSRRQWLQQQLGNTLQLLGFNLTASQLAGGNQSQAEFLLAGQSSHTFAAAAAMARRENMMKKWATVEKASKALPAITTTSSADHLQLVGQLDELRARQDELKLEARVIGGTDARLGDSPWSVSLQALVSRPGTGSVEYRHYCGGTIISQHYILTAAHCLDFMVGRESRLFVVMGDLNWRMSAASVFGKRMAIEKLIIHSGYKSTAFGHDIGLIKTREPIKPVRANGRYIVNSVCLPERNVEHTGEAELVGWGLFSNRNEMADSLQIADVPILPRPLCVDLYRRRTGLIQWLIGIELITDKQICAGTFGRGICQGDSGSALVYNEKLVDGQRASNKATIIGVVAFGGIRRCSYQSLPGVYMQTSKYLEWILPRIQS